MVIPKSVFCWAASAIVVTVAAVAWAEVQIPPGYEVVNITDDPADDRYPRMNNCGEVVFHKTLPGDRVGVFLYDNGRTRQVSVEGQYNTLPDINDDDVMVWTRWDDGTPAQILIYEDGVITELTDGLTDDRSPRINNLGHVVWKRLYLDGCGDADMAIMFYDGTTIAQLTDNGYSNQSGKANENDDIVWTRYNFCASPWWESEIMLWVDGVTAQLTNGQVQPSGPSINNRGQVAWGALEGLELWEDGITTRLTDWGRGPSINNRGEILLHRWDDDEQTSYLWVYRDGAFYQIMDDPFLDSGRDINDDGEAVWRLGPSDHRDVWVMRRVRDGDLDVDSDVDNDDSGAFPECMTGPVESDHLCACRFYDLDHDRDVDLRDFGKLQNLFTGEN